MRFAIMNFEERLRKEWCFWILGRGLLVLRLSVNFIWYLYFLNSMQPEVQIKVIQLFLNNKALTVSSMWRVIGFSGYSSTYM